MWKHRMMCACFLHNKPFLLSVDRQRSQCWCRLFNPRVIHVLLGTSSTIILAFYVLIVTARGCGAACRRLYTYQVGPRYRMQSRRHKLPVRVLVERTEYTSSSAEDVVEYFRLDHKERCVRVLIGLFVWSSF